MTNEPGALALALSPIVVGLRYTDIDGATPATWSFIAKYFTTFGYEYAREMYRMGLKLAQGWLKYLRSIIDIREFVF